MIVLLGESGSGKSTYEKIIAKKFGVQRVILYTTRPKRDGEIDGIDYHFVDNLRNRDNLLMFKYNDWKYAINLDEIIDFNNSICSLSPDEYMKWNEIDSGRHVFEPVYISVPARERLIRLLMRGDEVDEIIRRYQSEKEQFKHIMYIVNKVFVPGRDDTAEENAEYLYKNM